MTEMRLGYPCINRSIGCTSNHTFRLASYSKERLVDTVKQNLDCLERILHYNSEKGFFFFRISSDIIPFASHPVCRFDWMERFSEEFIRIGEFIKKKRMRISMHPDQFTLINAKDAGIVKRSIAELDYHCSVLDLMKLDTTAKVQIHVGGVYGDKPAAIQRFSNNYRRLPDRIKRRLAVENDHKLFSLRDCLEVHRMNGAPVIFDTFHHECLSDGRAVGDAMLSARRTWKKKDGPLMVDYSSQKRGARTGTHTESIDMRHFRRFIEAVRGIDFDLMLEVKDKEKSALRALKALEKSGFTRRKR